MTKKEMLSLEIWKLLLHKRYGIVEVIEVRADTPIRGVVVKPPTDFGVRIMYKHTGKNSLLVIEPTDIEFITRESVSRFAPDEWEAWRDYHNNKMKMK